VFAAPPPLGSTTPNTVAATTLTTTSNAAIGTTSSSWGGISAALQLASYGTVASAGTVLWTGSNFYYNGGEKFVTTGKATRFAYEDGDFIWLASASGTAGNAVSFNQKMKLTESTGDLTLNEGNLVIGTSGKGIDFSATPGTGTSELLADYEEGTFTPTLFYDTAGFDGTYTTQIGQYTKVGNLVTVLVVIGISSKGINSGDVQLRGLPFTFSATVNANNSGGNAVLLTGFNGTLFTLGFRGIAATSNCYLMKNNAGFTTTMTPADLQDAAGFSVTFSYLV
jgi:hypothetical protein